MTNYDDRWARRQARWERRRSGLCKSGNTPAQGLILGALIVAFGALLLLDNLGIIHFRDIWEYWPVILIVVGVARMADARGSGSIVAGGIIAGLGTIFLLRNLDIFYVNFNLLWPIAIIGFGVSMLVRAMDRGRYIAPPPGVAASGSIPADEPTLGLWAIFGGGKRVVQAKDFRGGDVSAMFGGYDLDFRDAAIGPEPAVMDLNVMFGGVTLRVPETWIIDNRATALFGGIDDKSTIPRLDASVPPQRLILTGYVIFGGVEVKN